VEALTKLRHACGSSIVARGWVEFWNSLGYEPGRFLLMVESNYHVVQANRERGNLELIDFSSRHTFEASPQFVAEHASPTALERRQRRC
jgi:hypothetical protein